MSEILLKVKSRDDEFAEFFRELDGEYGVRAYLPQLSSRFQYGGAVPSEIIVMLSSAGAFTAFYQIIVKYMERHKDRELTIEKGDTKITIKGHSLPEERELMIELFSEKTKIAAMNEVKASLTEIE